MSSPQDQYRWVEPCKHYVPPPLLGAAQPWPLCWACGWEKPAHFGVRKEDLDFYDECIEPHIKEKRISDSKMSQIQVEAESDNSYRAVIYITLYDQQETFECNHRHAEEEEAKQCATTALSKALRWTGMSERLVKEWAAKGYHQDLA